jgi:succinyl-CoA synthetase beta subunit
MRILENEAKQLLKAEGLSVPEGEVAFNEERVEEFATRLACPVVLKAQIPLGGRYRAGAVLFAENPDEALTGARRLLGKRIQGFEVEAILVEKKVDIQEELFISTTYDSRTRRPIVLASKQGGVSIEATVGIVRRTFSCNTNIPDYLGTEIAAQIGFRGEQVLQVGKIVTTILRLFTKWDALLLEVNPVVIDGEGHCWAVDAHLELDDSALFRQKRILDQVPQSRSFLERKSEFEKKASQIDKSDHRGVAGRVVPFQGGLGLLIGGGGASLTIFDAILEAQLDPANYCEIGGNPSVWKIKELTKLILSQPKVKKLAVIMNIVSNTRADLVARGVIKGILELGKVPHDTIIGFRIPGSWEEESYAILENYDIPYFTRETGLDEVVEVIKLRS